MADIKYIIFALEDQKFGMKLERVKGLEPLMPIAPVPMGPQYIKGIIHLRGEVVPIYNLKESFLLEDTRVTETRQIMVAESHGIKMGFEVDDVMCIVSISEDEPKELPWVACNEKTLFVESVIRVTLPEQKKSDLLLSIDVDKLMSESEFEDVKDSLSEQTKATDEEDEIDVEESETDTELSETEATDTELSEADNEIEIDADATDAESSISEEE